MQARLPRHQETKLDLVLAAIGIIAAFAPISGLLLAPLGVVSLATWFRLLALPAAVVLALIAIYGLARNPRLFNIVDP
jgi:hypothetical protein